MKLLSKKRYVTTDARLANLYEWKGFPGVNY